MNPVLKLNPDAFELVRLSFWNDKLNSEESLRELSITPGLREALSTFNSLKFEESSSVVDWVIGLEVAHILLSYIRKFIANGAAAVWAIPLISMLDQLKEITNADQES